MNKPAHLSNGVLVGGAIGALLGGFPEVLAAVPLGAAGSLLPDLDTDSGTHRKTSHNLLFLAVLLVPVWFYPVFVYLPIGVASHYVLDACCSRRGIALFYPVSATEYQSAGGVTVDDRRAPVVTGMMSLCEVGVFWLLAVPFL